MRFSQLGAFAALLCPAFAFAAATISLKAVAKNGVAIPPTNVLNISPNDLITAEVLLSGWNNPPFDGGSALIQTYQVTLLGKQGALSSGSCGPCNSGYVLPRGWDAPLERDPCPCDDPCYPICNVTYGCVGPNFHPEQMASMDRTRQDFIFCGFDSICGVDLSSPDIRWGCTVNGADGQTASRCQGGTNTGASCSTNAECPGGTCNANFLSYLGTLNLKVGSSVCGTYTYSFSNNPAQTFIGPPDNIIINITPVLQGLTLVSSSVCPLSLGACCNDFSGNCVDNAIWETCSFPNQRWGGPCSTCATMDPVCSPRLGSCCNHTTGECHDFVSQANCDGEWIVGDPFPITCATILCGPVNVPARLDPPNCAIDARQPYPPNAPSQRQGFKSWTWTFQNPLTTGEDAPGDFTIRQLPYTTPPVPPTISSVVAGPGNTVVLNFSSPIQPNHWTCVKHQASGVEQCLGAMPGDVNGDAVVVPYDILKLVDNLNHVVVPPLQMFQCDIDRSTSCAPADILRLLDLINGVTGFPRQYHRTLDPCPSAP